MKRDTMKPGTAVRNILSALMVALLLISGSTSAQANSEPVKESAKKMNALGNIIMGIESGNKGLSRSCIYFAGLYRMPETVQPLMEKLKNETDASTKVLIALALFRIGDPEGMEMVESLAVKDSDPKVRRMCGAIYNEYSSPDSLNYVTN